MLPIYDVATWRPLLEFVEVQVGGHAAGHISPRAWSVPVPGRTFPAGDVQQEWDAVGRVLEALKQSGLEDIWFVVQAPSPGRVVLHLLEPGAVAQNGAGPHLDTLILADGAVPEPWRRLPDPVPAAMPARSADPELLRRTLRERLPGAEPATEAEIAAAGARLGVALPDELKALFHVVHGGAEQDFEETIRVADVLGVFLYPLDQVFIADVASRPAAWASAASVAVATGPGVAVQQLVGSPGWIVFGDDAGNGCFAVDLTPGPAGHTGQIIFIPHDETIGASLYADSLTDLVVHRRLSAHDDPRGDRPPLVAHVNARSLPSIEAAADPRLEVLLLGVRDGAPLSLEPVIGLPRLRTLRAYPGTLADPRQVTELTALEYLALSPADWRVLLDAGAVPRHLLAAGIEVGARNPNPLDVAALAVEILALFDRPPIKKTVLEL
ncbi:SMI1/KNR4 family protein [Paractinoplanes atraurantiacus]|uniref:SMI1/KNR4 family protein n=1 Tax=Paractinoplanes atraurantiacus TaxID=1036182 RepID=UPI001C541518|nr:SMI1/KNR4 family protein [Actinoplanes atraurantiacus]